MKKYSFRFGIIFVLIVLASFVFNSIEHQTVKLLSFKTILVSLAFLLSEIFWIVYFKPYIGPIEKLKGSKLIAFAILRALLYLGIVFGFTLGL